MSTIVTRAGKGTPLTHNEVDANFTNLNTDKLETSGGTMTGDLSFGDNIFATFNSAGSFAIASDATVGTFIVDNTPQGITAQTDTLFVSSASGADLLLTAQQGSAVDLYHNNVLRLSTTATGVSVTGTVTATALSGDGASVTNVDAATLGGDSKATILASAQADALALAIALG